MLVFTIYLIFSMLAVTWFDLTRFKIPNWLTGSLLILYPIAIIMSPVTIDWKMDLVGMAGVFAVGYIIFAKKWMGGGDIKLITVCSLWVGLQNLADFIFLFAIAGGVFSVAVWVIRKILPYLKLFTKPPRILQDGAPISYGVAIAIGFLILLWTHRIPVLA